MNPTSRVSSLDVDVHLVLCDFGRAGLAYVETDPTEADATTVVMNLLHGQYERPLRIIAINADEGWSRDVSETIAAKVRDVADHESIDLTSGTLAFIEAHLGRAIQPTTVVNAAWCASLINHRQENRAAQCNCKRTLTCLGEPTLLSKTNGGHSGETSVRVRVCTIPVGRSGPGAGSVFANRIVSR